jgi:tRNA G18 (ribose-2'-O)-methylase SpoU
MPRLDLHTIDDPRLIDYRDVKDRQLAGDFTRDLPHNSDNSNTTTPTPAPSKFMAEGESVVGILIRSAYPVLSVLCARQRLTAMAGHLAALEAAAPHVPIYIVDSALIEPLIGFPMHRGVMAIGLRTSSTSSTSPAPEPDTTPHAEARRVIALATPTRPLVVLEDIFNHDNIGGMFRNAAAFGAAGILLTARCSDPLYRKAIRVSMGHALRVPFAFLPDVPPAPHQPAAPASWLPLLHDAGIQTVAMTPRQPSGTTDLEVVAAAQRAAPRRVAILIGSEGPGLSAQAIAGATHRVSIAMAPGTDSLNAYVAGAVALHRLAMPEA